MLIRPDTAITDKGRSTVSLFSSAITPEKLDTPPSLPGNVSARAIGKALCNEKYIGKSLFCKAENCGRGSALYAVVPPMKD